MDNYSCNNIVISIDRLYRFNNDELWDLRTAHKDDMHVFNVLPHWTFNDNGKLIEAANWLQFIGHMKDEKPEEYFYLFDITTTDILLQEEISNAGFDGLTEEEDWKKIITALPYDSYDDFKKHKLPSSRYLTSELIYESSYDHYNGGYDYEMYFNITGYLDNKLNKVNFKKENNGKS